MIESSQYCSGWFVFRKYSMLNDTRLKRGEHDALDSVHNAYNSTVLIKKKHIETSSVS